MTTNSLKNGSHVIVREGDTPFYLWSSTYYSSPLGVKHAQVRCIKDEAEVMEAEGIEYSAARIGSQVWTTENMRHVSGTNHDCIKPTGTSFFELCALIGATPCHIQI
jgi:hypothetical protein